MSAAGHPTETKHLILYSADLLSKWGFQDGDCPDDLLDWLAAHGFDDVDDASDDACWDRVLRRLVRERLLPALGQKVEVVDIEGIHNPIRASAVDGVDVHRYWYGDRDRERPKLTPESIAIPYDDILAMVREAQPHTLSGSAGTARP